MNSPIQAAISKAGGNKALADAIGVTPAFVYQLAKGIRPVPIELRPKIEAATKVRCEAFGAEVEWVRDESGRVTHFRTPVGPAPDQRAA